MRCRNCQPLPEGVARAADLLGRRWVLAILWASSEAGAVRFNEFKQTLEGIPPRTLALVRHQDRHHSEAAQAFVEATQAVCAELQRPIKLAAV